MIRNYYSLYWYNGSLYLDKAGVQKEINDYLDRRLPFDRQNRVEKLLGNTEVIPSEQIIAHYDYYNEELIPKYIHKSHIVFGTKSDANIMYKWIYSTGSLSLFIINTETFSKERIISVNKNNNLVLVKDCETNFILPCHFAFEKRFGEINFYTTRKDNEVCIKGWLQSTDPSDNIDVTKYIMENM